MKYLMICILFFLGCTSKQERTKWTDPIMRVMVDPDTIDVDNYVRITNSIITNGKFIVVDRGAGYRAARKEQERLHVDKVDRFDDREKYALWKKLYGVGGIVTAHSQCERAIGFMQSQYVKCRINLAIVNSSTSEVITTAEDFVELENGEAAPNWNKAVDTLAKTFPKFYEKDLTDNKLNEYKDISKESALRAREINQEER